MNLGIREICDVVFKARNDTYVGKTLFKKGQPVLYITTAKTSSLEGAVTQVYAQGGKGNPRLIGWEGERTLTFTVEDAVISPISFALLSGAGLSNVSQAAKDNKIHVHTTFDLPILPGGVVKIDYDDAGANHDIYISDTKAQVFGTILDNAGAGVVFVRCTNVGGVEGNCVEGDTDGGHIYTITREKALELTFDQADKYVGKTMRVDCYCEKSTGATEITIDAENFAGNYYVEASTLFREQHSSKDFPAEIVIPNAKIQSNFTFTMSASGDPSTFSFVMDAFPDYTAFDKTHKVFAAIQIVGDENIHPDIEDTGETEPCEVLDPAISAVAAGVAGWNQSTLEGDTVQFAKLGNNLKATIDRANVDFYGNLNKVANWGKFAEAAGVSADELTGYFYPFEMLVPDTATVTCNQPIVTVTASSAEPRIRNIWCIDPNKPVVTATVTKGGKSSEYSFDFSKCVFK